MPVTPTYPGVYIEEVPSQVRTIVGVATSITAFVGMALRGPVNRPVRIQSFGDFDRAFGGLWTTSSMSYAVQQFFLNGGTDAIIVRVVDGVATAAGVSVPTGGGPLDFVAANPGLWGGQLRVRVDLAVANPGDVTTFNLYVKDMGRNAAEEFRNVSISTVHPRYVRRVLEQESQLLRVSSADPLVRPNAHPGVVPPRADPFAQTNLSADDFYSISNVAGSDGGVITSLALVPANPASKQGIYALDDADLFNLLCLPPPVRSGDVDPVSLPAALRYCKDRRAMLILDPPGAWNSVGNAVGGVDALLNRDENAVLYFPRVRMADPLLENRLETFVPCGAMAGVIARTDAQRGVWKAPAGQDAGIVGARELSVRMTDPENGQLNPLGVNCLRTFPVVGNLVWGARTFRGADRLADQWKYLPVRRLALFMEESLYRGTQWAVFEPNDEPLWAQLRLNIGAFMQDLFRKGAFQGSSPREAYLVKCDRETTTQNDINLGIVNILVGFAPLKPAEFVMIRIQQLAGNVTA